MQDSTEKFYDTYGKNVSFEKPFQEEQEHQQNTAKPTASVGYMLKKYIALSLFIVLIGGIALIGSVFLLVFLSILLIDFIIRSIFFRSSSSSILIIKK